MAAVLTDCRHFPLKTNNEKIAMVQKSSML
nr:MAG TPA: hypothetical protein [Caudoviricetes sp.]